MNDSITAILAMLRDVVERDSDLAMLQSRQLLLDDFDASDLVERDSKIIAEARLFTRIGLTPAHNAGSYYSRSQIEIFDKVNASTRRLYQVAGALLLLLSTRCSHEEYICPELRALAKFRREQVNERVPSMHIYKTSRLELCGSQLAFGTRIICMHDDEPLPTMKTFSLLDELRRFLH